MSFISYAQNFEDVMLWRTLKHVGPGFYIDVGAWSPNVDSVTRAFYEAGWHGINVEPNPEFFDQLEQHRSRDTNLKLAVGDHEGSVTINFVSNPGLSTANDAFAAKHAQDGWDVRREEVTLTTLTGIWQQHVPSGQDVHFLKVDVEGLEEAVIRGNDWAKNRPWVLLVEATLPMSQVESFDEWEPILLSNNYVFAYADGLNRYYVADEHVDLLTAFKYPPNVFDEFLLSTQVEARVLADQAYISAEKAHANAKEAHTFAEEANQRAEEALRSLGLIKAELERSRQHISFLDNELFQVYQSRSWRITAPVRWFATQTRRLRQEGLKSRTKALIRKFFFKLRNQVLKYPQAQTFLKSSGLHAPLKSLFLRISALSSPHHQVVSPGQTANRSARSRKIHAQLKAAVSRQDKAKL